jgi:hypothetical protein
MERRDVRQVNLFGRLAPGATLKQAQTELSGISKNLERQYPETNKSMDAEIMTFNQRFNGGPIESCFSRSWERSAVLLIACANVANLLLSIRPALEGDRRANRS